MNTKKYVFLFKIVLFLVNYHECYFVFIEFEYCIKLSVWTMKTLISGGGGGPGTDQILDFRGGGGFNFRYLQGGPKIPRDYRAGYP